MNKMPIVSIIIPIYNVEKYLSECLESVINQTYKNLEIILIDDGSPDNCGKICDMYAKTDNRIKVIHKQNGGVSSARNIGIDVSSGDWMYFMDSDDIIDRELIELSLTTALCDDTDMCFFDYERFSENSSKEISTLLSNKNVFINTNSTETFYTFFSGWGCVWSFILKSCLIKNKIKFDDTIDFSEDELFKFQIYNWIKSFSYLHKTLYHYRCLSSSACGMVFKRKDYPNMMLNIYGKMIETINNGKYPPNAIVVANTRLVSRISTVVLIAFENRFRIKCDYNLIKNFTNSTEYNQAIKNYDKKMLNGFSNTIYLSIKKYNRFTVTVMYLIIKVVKKLINL